MRDDKGNKLPSGIADFIETLGIKANGNPFRYKTEEPDF